MKVLWEWKGSGGQRGSTVVRMGVLSALKELRDQFGVSGVRVEGTDANTRHRAPGGRRFRAQEKGKVAGI